MDDKLELDALVEEIKLTEQKLSDLRKEYRERKTAGVRAAIEARNEADKVLREELRAIGYRDPVDFWRGRALQCLTAKHIGQHERMGIVVVWSNLSLKNYHI